MAGIPTTGPSKAAGDKVFGSWHGWVLSRNVVGEPTIAAPAGGLVFDDRTLMSLPPDGISADNRGLSESLLRKTRCNIGKSNAVGVSHAIARIIAEKPRKSAGEVASAPAWRSRAESRLIRMLVWQWLLGHGPWCSGRALARWLAVSHTVYSETRADTLKKRRRFSPRVTTFGPTHG